MPPAITRNTLFYGDNLNILREHIPDESVDLIYLDPPFNSNRSYNVLFKDESGKESQAQIAAFDDAWHWDSSAAMTYHNLIQDAPARVASMIGALHDFIGENQMMAYLVMMTARLVELHRVLKPTGSLYLHCDPTASHYLKIILDTTFGPNNFLNEIAWKRTTAHNDPKRFGRIGDRLLYYSKTSQKTFNTVPGDYSEEQLSRYKKVDKLGPYRAENLTAPHYSETRTIEWRGTHPGANRQWRFSIEELERLYTDGRILLQKDGRPRKDGYKEYLYEAPGPALQDIWSDIAISPTSSERLGYPTQKPLALLERIVQASSNPGDVVLDPFCGCGTAVAAAHKLGRRWIGIDITHLAISLQKYRLQDAFNLRAGRDYDVIGEPASLDSARQLAQEDRYQFQLWALGLVNAKPLGSDDRKVKKGKDRGIDGVKYFVESTKGHLSPVLVQVKSGHVKSGDIRDLHGVLDRENAPLGVFITLEPPTKDMEKEALAAGYYLSPLWRQSYPRIQIATIEQLLSGELPWFPPSTHGDFAKAERVKKDEGSQTQMDI